MRGTHWLKEDEKKNDKNERKNYWMTYWWKKKENRANRKKLKKWFERAVKEKRGDKMGK